MQEASDFVLVEPEREGINLVLKGGGSRAFVYLGAIEALRDMKIYPEAIMGTSAGAIFGFFIATRVPLKELKAMLFDQPGSIGKFSNIFDFMSPEERKAMLDENLKKIGEIARKGDHITNAIHMCVASCFTLLRTIDWFSTGAEILTEQLINGQAFHGTQMLNILQRILNLGGHDQMMNFKDFKQTFNCDFYALTTDIDARMPRLLNAFTTPDLPVVMGIMMSSAVPLYYPPVVWKKEYGLYKGEDISGHLMVDGGIISNIPIRFMVSNEPYISELRGGKFFSLNRTIILSLNDKESPEMVSKIQANGQTEDEEKNIEALPIASMEEGSSGNPFSHWDNFSFFSEVMSKLRSLLHAAIGAVGMCDKHPHQGPPSWDEVTEEFADLQGPKVMAGVAATLYGWHDKLPIEYYKAQIIKLGTKGIKTFSEGLSAENTRPFTRNCQKLVTERLKSMFEPVG